VPLVQRRERRVGAVDVDGLVLVLCEQVAQDFTFISFIFDDQDLQCHLSPSAHSDVRYRSLWRERAGWIRPSSVS